MRFVLSISALLLTAIVFLFEAGCPKKVQTTQETSTAGATKPNESSGSSAPEAPPTRPEAPLREESVSPSPAPVVPDAKKAPEAENVVQLEDVFFDFDKWVLGPQAKESLLKDARWLSEHPEEKIQVEGHCDERGTNEYNLVLGEHRAREVMSYLVHLGVAPQRLSLISYGEERPFCSEHTEACYQKNRRAHLVGKSS